MYAVQPYMLRYHLRRPLTGNQYHRSTESTPLLHQSTGRISIPLNRKPSQHLKLYIKYMVSLRCKMVVIEELKKLNLQFVVVDLGTVELLESITEQQRELLKEQLKHSGLELLDDKRAILIERIKNVIVEMIHYEDELPVHNYSVHISEKLNHDYTYLSNIFSEVKGVTIQQFIIQHKIERVKELLLYDELNLTEIAYKLNYSSVAHLSSQFKKVTGLTPSFFKTLKEKKRSTLEDL